MSVVVLFHEGQELGACLRGLAESEVQPVEVVVVDSCPRCCVVDTLGQDFPRVRFVGNPAGPGARRQARRIGRDRSTGSVIIYLDADAVPDRAWLGTLVAHFADPAVAGVGGRLVSRAAGGHPRYQLSGRMLADGRLVPHFRVDPGRPAVVDHLSGVNMAFRRAALGGLSGREYPGTAQWEDADVCWHVRTTTGRLVFEPRAVVLYEPGRPRAGGRPRSRPMRHHYTVRNNLALLIRQGQDSQGLRPFVQSTLRSQLDHLHVAAHLLRSDGRRARAVRVRSAAQQVILVGGEVSGLVRGTLDGLLARSVERR